MGNGGEKNLKNVEAGGMVFFEGDLGSEMYIIRSGGVEVVRKMGDGEVVLATLGPSQFFGEMALFGEPRRSAGVRAVEPTGLFVINKRMLEAQFRQIPEWLVAMIKTVAQRIISTGKGVRVQFEISLEYSILELIALLLQEFGTTEEKGQGINLDLVRQEIVNVLGVGIDQVDPWLKKFDFTNLAKVRSSNNRLVVLDPARLNNFIKYLRAKKTGQSMDDIGLDKNAVLAFERLNKLLHR